MLSREGKILFLLFLINLLIAFILTLVYPQNVDIRIWHLMSLTATLFSIFGFFLLKIIRFQEIEIIEKENTVSSNEALIKSEKQKYNDLAAQKKAQQLSFNQSLIRQEENHYNKVIAMKEEHNKRVEKLGKKIVNLMSEEMEIYKVETKDKLEKEILDKVFSSTSDSFNQSKEISREEKLRAERQKEEELKRREDKIEMDEKITTFIQQTITWKEGVNQKVFDAQKSIIETKAEFSEKVNRLEIMIIQGLQKLETKIDTAIAKIEQRVNELRTWAERNLTEMKFHIKEEILRLDQNHIKIVNKMEEFVIQYKGDQRGNQQKFDDVNTRMDKNQHTLNHRIDGFEIRYKGDQRDIQQQFDGVNANMDKSQHELNNKIDRNEIRYQGDKRGIQQQFDGMNLYIDKTAHYANERLLALDVNVRKDQLRLDRRVDANNSLFDDIQHNLEKGLLSAKMERQNQYNATQNNITEMKFDNERKVYFLDNKFEKRMDNLAAQHQVSVKELNHLMEVKGYQIKDVMNMNHHEIKNEITNIKTNHQTQWKTLDAKFNVQLSDLKTVHMKHLYEQDQKILKIVNKIESFHNDIGSFKVKMDSMKVQIQQMGLENENVKQEAKHLLNSIQMRMDNINSSLKMAREMSNLVEKRIQNNVQGDLLKLKEITVDQESKLKEIAFADHGMKLMYQDYENKTNEKEIELRKIEARLEDLNKKIELERQRMEMEGRSQAMSQKLYEYKAQRDSAERDAREMSRDANMYKKMAHHYQKKSNQYY